MGSKNESRPAACKKCVKQNCMYLYKYVHQKGLAAVLLNLRQAGSKARKYAIYPGFEVQGNLQIHV